MRKSIGFFVLFGLILSLIAVAEGCKPRPATKTSCYNPLAAPVPFDLQPGDYFTGNGGLVAKRGGNTFVLHGSICISVTPDSE